MDSPNNGQMRRCVTGLAAVSLAVLAAACGSTSPGTTTRTLTVVRTVTTTVTAAATTTAATTTATTTAATTTAATTTAATTPATTTAPSTTSTAAGTSVACTAATLEASFLGSNAATGTVVLSFSLRNSSERPCHTYGFPGVAFVSTAGAPISTTVSHTTQDLLGSTPELELVLAPGDQASFRMVTTDTGAGGGDSGCDHVSGVQIIAPDDTVPMRVSLPSGAVECGRTGVSPLLAGSNAVPGV